MSHLIKTKYLVALLTIIFALCVNKIYAQQGNIFTNFKKTIVRADQLFEDNSYVAAIDLYKEVLEKEPENGYAKIKIARSYKKLNDHIDAETWFRVAIENNNYAEPLDQLYFAQVLMINGKYEEAKNWLVRYTKTKKDIRAINNLVGIEQRESLFKDSALYKLEAVNVNTAGNDFSPVFYDSALVFLSNREKISPVKYINTWADNGFYDVYQSPIIEGKTSTETTVFNRIINSKYHEGPLAFYNGGRSMIFTRSIEQKNAKEERTLGLFTAEKTEDNKSWTNIQAFSYNSREYSVFHPAISEDGDTLYFSSEMPGGYGGGDIYRSVKEEGSWSKPENLGSQVNTEGNELFPYLNKDLLYFSSDGHAGLGGLDIYKVALYKRKALQVINMGFPLNSSYDDFSLAWHENQNIGALSSNRPNGKGSDDIYFFENQLKPENNFLTINGSIIDKSSKSSVDDASIYIIDEQSGEDYSLKTDRKGRFKFQAKKGHSYTILADNAQKSGLISGKTILDESEIIEIEIWGFPPYVSIEPEIRDVVSGESIKLATVKLKQDGMVVSQEQTSFSGKTILVGNAGSSYSIEVNAIGYVPTEKKIQIPRSNFPDTLRVAIKLEKEKPKVAVIKGIVSDVLQKKGIEGARIFIINDKKGERINVISERDGAFGFEGVVGDTYEVIAEVEDNRAVVRGYKIEDPALAKNEDILLQVNIKKPKQNNDLVPLKIFMRDQNTKEAIAFGVVKLFSEDTIRQIDYTSIDGDLLLKVERNKNFILKSDVLGYKESIAYTNTSGDLLSDTIQLAFLIEPLVIQTIQGFAIHAGQTISDAKIYVINETSGKEEEISTDKDGGFSFIGKEGEIISILAEKDKKRGVLNAIELTERHFTAPLQIQLNSVSTFVIFDLSISDKKDGEGIPLAYLQLKENEIPQLLTKSDMWGKASLKAKKGVNYVLEVSHAGYKNMNYPLAIADADNDTISVSIRLEKQLPGMITMKGSMYMEGSKMVSKGSSIFIVNEQTGESKVILTDDEGNFHFEAKAGEVYDIVGEDRQLSGMVPDLEIKGPDNAANDEIRLPVNNLISGTGVKPVVRNDELLTKGVLQIIDENQIKFNEIVGLVYDKKTGGIVNEASVYIINNSTGETHSLVSDDKGNFKFKSRLGQEVTILADKGAKSGLLPYLEIKKADELIKVGIWGFPPPVVLQVILRDKATKKPVRLAMVGLQEGNNYIQQEQTQIFGTVYLRASVEGKYTILAEGKGYETQSLPFEVPSKSNEGDTLKIDLYLAKKQPKLLAVTGSVINESTGEAMDSVKVFIMNSKTWEVETVQTNNVGKFGFKGLSGEHYQIIGEKDQIGTNLLDYIIAENNDPLILKIEEISSRKADVPKLVYLKVKLRDAKSGNAIPQGVVKLSLQDTVKQTVYVDNEGEKIFRVYANEDYYIQGSKLDYATSGQKVITQTQNPTDTIMVLIGMESVEKKEVRITGVAVNGQTNETMSDIVIYVRNETTGADQEMYTEAGGTFTFAGTVGDTYTILGEGGGSRGNLNKFTVNATNTSSPIQLKLYPLNIPLIVKVQLNDSENNESIALADLTLRYQNAYQQTINSNAEGTGIFHAHAGKDYSLEINHPAYKNQVFSAKSSEAKKDTIFIHALLEKDLPLSITMHGHVYDVESKRPLGAANIYIINDRNAETLEFKADERGDFSFQATEGFTYTILADNNIRSGMVTDLLITDPQEKANPFIKIPAFGMLQPVTIHAKVIDDNTREPVPGVIVKQYAENTHIRELKTDFQGKIIWEEYKNDGFHLVVDKQNFDKKLVPLEFGNAKSGDTLFLTIPIKNLRPDIMLASNYAEPSNALIFNNIRIVHNSGGNKQVFLSMDKGLFAYKQQQGKAVLENATEVLPFAEELSEEESLLLSLYNALARKNLLVLDTIDLQNLYYGFDKFQLSSKSIADLDKIITVMKLHPEIKVELKAYTDSRGPANYNMVLAKRRVLSAFQYLIKQDISRSRIIQTPVGEAEYIKDCKTEPCSEEDHKLKRRTEMLIRYEVEMLGSN